MYAGEIVVLIAAVVACVGALASTVASVVLVNQIKRIEGAISVLREEIVPLAHEAHSVAIHASNEMARVEAVLADTQAVSATVDSATRLAHRAFGHPVVKFLTWRAGARAGVQRFRNPQALDKRVQGVGVESTRRVLAPKSLAESSTPDRIVDSRRLALKRARHISQESRRLGKRELTRKSG